MSSLFAEDDYCRLLLVDDLKQRYDIETCLDLFIRLKQHDKRRIWVNIHDRKVCRYNSFFVDIDNIEPKWDGWIVLSYYSCGFYDRYYVVNCMIAEYWQQWRVRTDILRQELEEARQERKKIEEQKRLCGRQYNMFGGLD